MTITWQIKPLNTPAVLRNCSHCGGQSAFICSNKFRVNAQQRSLDVWLIYNCEKCGCSWNMAILSRVRPQEIDTELYDGFLENSAELAFRYAFDADLLRRNNASACYDDVTYEVEGDDVTLETLQTEDVTLHIRAPYNLQLRLDKLLREKLGLSRRAWESCLQCGAVASDAFGFRPDKAKLILKGDMTLNFNRSASNIGTLP
jgi:hypothetical protein